MLILLWIIVSLVFVMTALYFTKQQVLKGRYAVLWLSTSSFMLGTECFTLYQQHLHFL